MIYLEGSEAIIDFWRILNTTQITFVISLLQSTLNGNLSIIGWTFVYCPSRLDWTRDRTIDRRWLFALKQYITSCICIDLRFLLWKLVARQWRFTLDNLNLISLKACALPRFVIFRIRCGLSKLTQITSVIYIDCIFFATIKLGAWILSLNLWCDSPVCDRWTSMFSKDIY